MTKTQRREFHRAIRAHVRQVRGRDDAPTRAARFNTLYRLTRAIEVALRSCSSGSPQHQYLTAARERLKDATWAVDRAYTTERQAIEILSDLVG